MLSTGREIRRHLFEKLLPLWLEKGWDHERGGFYDALEADLRPPSRDRKRLLAQCRQIFVFSRAHLSAAPLPALEAATRGFEYLRDRYLDSKEGGWYLTLTLDGRPLDRRKDSYTFAFVLFSLAHYYAASGNAEALKLAERTLDLMEDRLGDPVHGGFLEGASWDWTPVTEPRRQNPHMHLLEAMLALAGASPSPRYLDLARRLFRLFREKFFDPERGCLGEYFNQDWSPAPGEPGRITEPGHHFEWAWLLRAYAKAASEPEALEWADRLQDFGLRWGWDSEFGGVYDQVDREGRVILSGKRVWPMTELIKACASRAAQKEGGEALLRMKEALELCAKRHLDPATGLWKEHFNREGTLLTNPERPATSVYHILLALQEAQPLLPSGDLPC